MRHQYKPLALLCLMFLTVGALFTMNDVLLPTVMEYYKLNYVQATLVQVAFYVPYILFPVPIARIIDRYGYKISLIIALVISATGCFLFIPSQFFQSYPILLLAIFILASGIAIINIAANPFTTLLGDPEGAHIRINFVQSFSRIGYAITPGIATALIYNKTGTIDYFLPYMVLGVLILMIGGLIYFSKIPAMASEKNETFSFLDMVAQSKKYPHLLFGVIAMFFYVGAEASTAGFFLPYITRVQEIPMEEAVKYLSFYYIFAAVMGIIASLWLLKFIEAHHLVGILGTAMVCIYIICVFFKTGYNHYLLASLGLGLSIMFPTLFSLAIEKTGDFAAKGSALLNFALVGGAVFTPLQGLFADQFGVARSYLVPCLCFIIITLYALFFTYKPLNARKELLETI